MKRYSAVLAVILIALLLSLPNASAEQAADGIIEQYLAGNEGEGLYINPQGCCDDPYVGKITSVSNGVVYVQTTSGDNSKGAGYYINQIHYLHLQKKVRAEQGAINWPPEMGILNGHDWVYLEWTDGSYLSGRVVEVDGNVGVAYLAKEAWGKTTLYIANFQDLRYFRPLF